jgi:hypothetical protein
VTLAVAGAATAAIYLQGMLRADDQPTLIEQEGCCTYERKDHKILDRANHHFSLPG